MNRILKAKTGRTGWLSLSCIVALGLGLGCGSRSVDSFQESNTNWLSACDTDAECGTEFACQCGVCTVACDEQACPALLSCLASSQCGGSGPASCQAACDHDADCSTLSARAQCNNGVCVAPSGGLSQSVVTGGNAGPRDGGNSQPPDTNVTCRRAYIEYPVGARVSRDGCSSTDVCTCGSDGEWADCGGDDIVCSWSGPVRACSEMFPDLNSIADVPSDPITVTDAQIEGDSLSLEVGHGGGCEAHDYALCFSGYAESYPVQAGLKLIHDAHDDGCEAYLTTTLHFDLTPLAQDYMAAYQSDGDVMRTPYGLYSFGQLSCTARETASSIELDLARQAASVACASDTDCVTVTNSTGCHASCGEVFSTDGAATFAAAIDRIDADYCAEYESAGCGPVLVPPCDAPGAAGCVNGQCSER